MGLSTEYSTLSMDGPKQAVTLEHAKQTQTHTEVLSLPTQMTRPEKQD